MADRASHRMGVPINGTPESWLRMSIADNVDIDLIVSQLRGYGHSVGKVISVPDNAGEFEFVVDGETLSLSETRALLEEDQGK
jgi:hypothetical protein